MRERIRSRLEKLTRRIVFRRRMPPPFEAAQLFVSPAARLGYAFKSLEAADQDLLRCASTLVSPGQTVWDVGANIGLFSFAAAARAGATGRVFAFEPDLEMAALLRRSAAIQAASIAPTEVVPVALGGAVGFRSFSIASRARASNALAEYGRSEMGGIARTETVLTVTIDWLLQHLPPPDLIKIDVEGAELEVLQGRCDLLERARPVVICEVVRDHRPLLTEIFASARYRLYEAASPLRGAAPVQDVVWNTVALPEEKTDLIA